MQIINHLSIQAAKHHIIRHYSNKTKSIKTIHLSHLICNFFHPSNLLILRNFTRKKLFQPFEQIGVRARCTNIDRIVPTD